VQHEPGQRHTANSGIRVGAVVVNTQGCETGKETR
jgi:hypothetical protein